MTAAHSVRAAWHSGAIGAIMGGGGAGLALSPYSVRDGLD